MAATPSQEKLDSLRASFDAFDKDGNGTIDFEEFVALLREMGQEATEEELKAAMEEIDLNGDGEIQFNEFVNFVLAE